MGMVPGTPTTTLGRQSLDAVKQWAPAPEARPLKGLHFLR